MAGLGSVVAIGNDRRGLAVKSGRKACFSLVKWDNKLFSGHLFFTSLAGFAGESPRFRAMAGIPDVLPIYQMGRSARLAA